MHPEEKGHIDQLFKQELDDFRIEADTDQFDQMEIRLERLRFFQFSWRHFNIYYSSLIVLCFTFSLVAMVRSFYQETPEQQFVYIQPDSVNTSTLIPDPDQKQTPGKNTTTGYSSTIQTSEAIPLNADSISTLTPVVITSPVNPAAAVDTALTTPPKPKRIKYVNKRDTIIRYDTTKIIKKR